MNSVIEFLKSLHSVEGLKELIQSGGLFFLAAVVFAETGLLVGFFLPGDSLLITAGIFTSTNGVGGDGIFDLWTMIWLLTIVAIVGDQVGFLLGRKTGDLVFSKKDSMFFKKKHFDAAHAFYEKSGGPAIIIARFVPILRTFVPFAAGVSKMSYRAFVKFNIIGGFLWIWSLVLLGHYLGRTPLAKKLHQIIIIVIFVSILPLIYSAVKAWLASRRNKAIGVKSPS